MSSRPPNLNDAAWEKLFDKYDILGTIDARGRCEISASQIKEFREPRLMAKFDHTINLPQIFRRNQLAILPVTRGDYVISHFAAYHRFEEDTAAVTRVSLPAYIQSLDENNISSEAVSLNCAAAAGILADFLQDEDLAATVSGRMGSDRFSFRIANRKNDSFDNIQVNNSQIEIDAAYEGVRGLALFEAKRDLSEDFLIRQLYYPFRLWQGRVTKPVRTVFLVYSNGIYRLYEYAFGDVNNYNSLVLMKQKNYAVEDTVIQITDIQRVLRQVKKRPEPPIPFPQADSFKRIINLCELLSEQELSRNEITERYAFDARQTNYYTDAARYLGLLDKRKDGIMPVYGLTKEGKRILCQNYKKRQLAYCECILSHQVFRAALCKYFERGYPPQTAEIVQIMKQSNLYNVGSDSTFERRSHTVKGWIDWIISMINEYT